jgi:hypothetical protein
MKMNYLTKNIGLFLVFSTTLLLVGVARVDVAHAEEAIYGEGLAISPLRNELEVSPGVSQDGILWLTNTSERTMAVDMTVEEFNVVNADYDYDFVKNTGVAKWVSFDEPSFELAPGQYKEVVYTIGVPLTAEPIGKYFGIFASTNVHSADGRADSIQRVASLFYLTVSGDVVRAGEAKALSSPWFIANEGSWGVLVQNVGTTHFHSRYTVSVSDIFTGSKVAETSGSKLIIPSSVRSVVDVVPLPPVPGVYRVEYLVGLGDSPPFKQDKYVLYLPSYVMGVFLTVVLVGSIALSMRKKKS